MLHVGLTGGIGSGKSTVAHRLVERGALVIDSDRLAREVVDVGTEGLAAIRAEFGPEVLAGDGSLDRAALATRIFRDERARARLNEIVHPRVRQRSGQLVAAAAPDAVVVHDIPLLVEGGMAAEFPLVLVAHAEVDVRVRRLVEQRGMDEHDVRSRITTQATEQQRRAAADIWLDNSGSAAETERAVDALWAERLRPFEQNLRHGRPPSFGPPGPVEPDPDWPVRAEQLAAKVARAAGDAVVRVDHIGSTAVGGLASRPAIDLQLIVQERHDQLGDAGFVRIGPDRYVSADPGRPADLRVRDTESADGPQAVLLRDWLRADVAARGEFEAVKRAALERSEDGAYAAAKHDWFRGALLRAQAWAAATGWHLSSRP